MVLELRFLTKRLTETHTYPLKAVTPDHVGRPYLSNLRALTDDDAVVVEKLEKLQARLERCGYPRGLVATAMDSAHSINMTFGQLRIRNLLAMK